MNVTKIVLKELTQRKNQLVTSLIAVVMGIAVIVGIRSITYYSERAIAQEMDALGANVLILPKGVTVDDYYRADLSNETIPETYVDDVLNSGLRGVDNLSPKLSIFAQINGRETIVTGIRPREEFLAKPVWEMAGNIFETPVGCAAPAAAQPKNPDAVDRRTTIDVLPVDGVLLGNDVSAALGVGVGGSVTINDESFQIIDVLPISGTVDDGRVFTHLSTTQRMSGQSGRINAIEMMGCCQEISKDLIAGLNRILPDAKVVTINQIVSTQQKTNGMMRNFSLVFLVIIILVGGVSIANYMFANVYERRREVGILIALGANWSLVQRIFILKAVILGLAGGVGGFIIGTVLAMVMGPSMAAIAVRPRLDWLLYSVVIAVALSLIASIVPVYRVAKLDPFITLQEV